MTYFPDVNVWIAMSLPGPIHYPAAVDWFNRTNENQIAFCRVTQMGFLRLLTNRHVMGANVLTPARAWQAFDGSPPQRENLLRGGARGPA
jgi:predicted nucleic acid-binding protein